VLEYRSDSGEERAGLHRLAEVVVSAEIQCLFLVLAVLCSQHDHRQAGGTDPPRRSARRSEPGVVGGSLLGLRSALRITSHVGTMRAYSRVTYGGRSRLIAGGCMRCVSNSNGL
jgi:hypothetical protein